MKKPIKYLLLAIIVGIALYNAVYFEPLDKRDKTQMKEAFDPGAYAKNFMDAKVGSLPALKADQLIEELQKNLKKVTVEKGRKLGISNNYYFMIQGNATVLEIETENVLIQLEDSKRRIRIATDFIFGNTIREASGMANIGDYQNTMDFNNISVALNNILQKDVIPPFLSKVKQGDPIYFKGGIKVNTKHPDLDRLRIVPLILEIK